MRKTLLALGMLAGAALIGPHAANAGVSGAIGVPGVHVVQPIHGVAYERRYYRPYYRPRVYYGHRHRYVRDCHRGRGHYYHWKHRHDDRRHRHHRWDD